MQEPVFAPALWRKAILAEIARTSIETEFERMVDDLNSIGWAVVPGDMPGTWRLERKQPVDVEMANE